VCVCWYSENATAVTSDAVLVLINIGLCETNNLILNDTFVWYYQRAYVSMYVICLLVVVVLYVAVFSAVQDQRNWRQKRRGKQFAMIVNTNTTAITTASVPPANDSLPGIKSDSEQITEMVTVDQQKRNDAGAATATGGMEVMVLANDSRQPPAVVQTLTKSSSKRLNISKSFGDRVSVPTEHLQKIA